VLVEINDEARKRACSFLERMKEND
jgi:hypothetical protein